MTMKFVTDSESKPGVIYRPMPYLTRVVAPNAGPFTYTGTGTYLIGETELCIIDPGPKDERHLDALVQAINQRPVKCILITHTHKDHSPLSHDLAALFNAPIFGCPPSPQLANGDSFEEAIDENYDPQHVMVDGERVKGKKWTMRAIATPGHTSNHFCYLWEEENALFCGDHVMGWSTSVILPPDGDMTAYLSSLRKVRALNCTRLWPTHGLSIDQPAQFLDALIQHRLDREAAILKALKEGPMDIMSIVQALYTDTPKALFPAAARSVYAHLLKLLDEGHVRALGPATLQSPYTLT